MITKPRKTASRNSAERRPKAPTKHQVKSEATRSALLDAAEEVFARDGYERAQIDEIAKLSGRTRGAVYAQYKTKEQLFFALQALRIQSVATKAYESIKKRDSAEERLAAIRDIYADLRDSDTALLDMEMKLFALRNPQSEAGWRTHYLETFNPDEAPHFAEMFNLLEAEGRSKMQSRLLALTALKGGLILAMRFLPQQITPPEGKLLLEEVFDGLFPPAERTPPQKKRTA